MPLSYLQVIALAILQGVTELFPVSSLGHAVVIPGVLLWPIDPKGPGLLPFLVILHLGTAAALLVFYWREWLKLLLALIGGGDPAERPALRRLILMLIVGTVPAAVMGALFNKMLRDNFAVPSIAAGLLIINGLLLIVGDPKERLWLRSTLFGILVVLLLGGAVASFQNSPPMALGLALALIGAGLVFRPSANNRTEKPVEELTIWDALIIGVAQVAALDPGISRSGLTIAAGLGRKLNPAAAAHFSFLLATPIILGAGILEVPKLLHAINNGHADAEYLTKSLIGGVFAGVFAYLSVAFLTRYFRAHEVKTLRPFAIYCVVIGIGAIAIMLTRAPAAG
jgi:undecaprenyl-diphosphatase